MKKISRNVFFIKKIFPYIFLGLPVFISLTSAARISGQDPFVFVGPIVFGLIGYFIIRQTIGGLADEAYDCGTHLLVRNGSEEVQINFSDVMNVNVTTHMNPPRISLRLRTPGKFGDEVSFSPIGNGFCLNPFAKNAIAEDLILRVDRANNHNAVQ